MAIGTLFGSSPESSGLYGIATGTGSNPTIISQTYFEWFIFTTSAGTPAAPTGGSWDFNTNTGTAPAGWSSFISGVPLNSLWFSVAFIDSRNPTVITWTSPGLISSQSVYATAYADVFTGNGSTVAWTLTQDPVVVNNTDVSINGVTQVPGTDYTLSGTTLTTTTAAPLNAVILVKYRQALPLSYYGAASNVQFTPVGALTATNVQAAIAEVVTDLALSSGSSTVGFLQAGTGAVATTVQAKLRESVSALDFIPVALHTSILNGTNATPLQTYIQTAVTSSGGNVDFGSTGAFLITGPIGLPDQEIYSENTINLTGRGAKIVVSSAEAVFTSFASLSDPNSTDNLYTAKINVSGIDFVGSGASVLFNGDRLYNVYVTGCSFKSFTSVLKSFRPRLSGIEGYVQSFAFIDNHFARNTKIVDGDVAFNFIFNDNFCEDNDAGIYFESVASPAIWNLRVNNNLFEGGGLFLKCGPILGGSISNNYLEANNDGDAATLLCHMYLIKGTSIANSGLTISGNSFQPTGTQATNVNWADIRLSVASGYRVINTKPPVIFGNYSGSYSLLSKQGIYTAFGNGGIGGDRKSLVTGTPSLHTENGVSFLNVFADYPDATFLAAGVHTVAAISTAEIKAFYAAFVTAIGKAHTAELIVAIQAATAAGVIVGSSVAKILLVIQGAQTAGDVTTMYVGGTLLGYAEIPAGSVFDSANPATATMKKVFTAPALTIVASGADNYLINLSGYAAVTSAPYGTSSRIISSSTLTNYANAWSQVPAGLLNVIQG
jgi:hypothetical protein